MKTYLEQQGIAYKECIPIKQITGMNQKGIIPLVAYPDSIEKLEILGREILRRNLSFDILGGLTNTYLCESYKRDIVVITTKVQDINFYKASICVGCGYNLTKLSKELSAKGIAGYEGFIGIPGTVGAAAINNSGAFSSSMSKVVVGVNILTKWGGRFVSNTDLQYKTRSSMLKKNTSEDVVLSVLLSTANKENIESLKHKINEISQCRKSHVDGKRKSLGSVFVAPTLKELHDHHKFATTIKKICNQPFKIIFHNNPKINTYLDFLFLGKPSLAKHCDSLNRFCWDKGTTEKDFLTYIETMQKLAHNKLTLEISIKR